MFEMIGLLFAAIFLFGVAGIASIVSILVARAILKIEAPRRTPLIVRTALLPFACAGYILLATIVLEVAFGNQHDLLFGDIHEPLPNGYVLACLGKFSNFADIIHPYANDAKSGSYGVEGIQGVAVAGTTVYGEFSHEFRYTTPNGDYFAFDTRTNSTRTFRSKPELDRFAGHQTFLVDPSDFRSPDPAHRRLVTTERLIRFLPPVAALLFWPVFLLYQRRNIIAPTLSA